MSTSVGSEPRTGTTSGWNTRDAECSIVRSRLSSAATVAASRAASTAGREAGAWPGAIGLATAGTLIEVGWRGATMSSTP